MAVRRPSASPAAAPAVDEEEAPPTRRARFKGPAPKDEDSVYEAENEDEVPERSSIVQSGWGAAAKLAAAASGEYNKEVKLSEEETLLKFIGDDPFAVYRQHFIEKLPKGERKSFTCLEEDCPLCEDLLSKPDRKFAFNVLNLTSEAGFEHQSLVVGTKLLSQLQAFNDSRNGPLSKHYWTIQRNGTGRTTTYVVGVVKAADLEDWSLEEVAIKKALADITPYTNEIVRIDTRAELRAIVDIANK